MSFLIGVMVGAFLRSILAVFQAKHKNKNYPKHHRPRYYAYSGGWANVCECKCGSVSLYEDNHPNNPCADCGSKAIREEHSARWVGHWEFAREAQTPAKGETK